MDKKLVAKELLKIAKSLISGLGEYDIVGVPINEAESAFIKQYGKEDGKAIYSAFKSLCEKFLKHGNCAIKTGKGGFSLAMYKDTTKICLEMHRGGGSSMQSHIAMFTPTKEMVEAYNRIYNEKK